MRTLIASILTFAIVTGGITAQQPPRAPAREIVNVKGDIYRARNNNYCSLFMVTPDGIILADPINAAFATWMKEQFAERFKVPVKYVIYSHSHWDHIEGGAVFADTAHFIAQENVAKLTKHGYRFIGPEAGWLACRNVGAGRLSEPGKIVEEVVQLLTVAATSPNRNRIKK